jgi:hypothetical protein
MGSESLIFFCPDPASIIAENAKGCCGGLQTLCGCRSMSRLIRRHRGKQRRDSRGLCEQTKNAGRCAGVRGGDLDERDSGVFFDRPAGPQAESLAADGARATKTGLCRANSRVSLEVSIRNLREGFRVSPQPGFYFVTKGHSAGRGRGSRMIRSHFTHPA